MLLMAAQGTDHVRSGAVTALFPRLAEWLMTIQALELIAILRSTRNMLATRTVSSDYRNVVSSVSIQH